MLKKFVLIVAFLCSTQSFAMQPPIIRDIDLYQRHCIAIMGCLFDDALPPNGWSKMEKFSLNEDKICYFLNENSTFNLSIYNNSDVLSFFPPKEWRWAGEYYEWTDDKSKSIQTLSWNDLQDAYRDVFKKLRKGWSACSFLQESDIPDRFKPDVKWKYCCFAKEMRFKGEANAILNMISKTILAKHAACTDDNSYYGNPSIYSKPPGKIYLWIEKGFEEQFARLFKFELTVPICSQEKASKSKFLSTKTC